MIASQSFSLRQPTRIRFGCNAVSALGDAVLGLGCTKVFLVVDPGLEAAGLLERIVSPLASAGVPHVLYTKVEPEPGLRLADEGTALAREGGCDGVIGVGGGSAMDIAKAVSILLTNGGKAVDYLGLGKIRTPGVPKVMIPTTAGTGAEVTFTAVFINEATRSKGGMNGDPLYPDLALLDPSLTLSMPPRVTAATGIDALTHALEAFVSTQAHTVSDLYARRAIEMIGANLGMAYAHGGNLEARAAMLMGSLLAGQALATAGVGLVHAMAYPLGGMFNIPHGLANAILLPYVMAYNLIGSPQKYAEIAGLMGAPVDRLPARAAAEAAVASVRALNREIGIPSSLADLQIPADRIQEMARIALTVTRPVENNPRKPTLEEVVAVYENAFNKESRHAWV